MWDTGCCVIENCTSQINYWSRGIIMMHVVHVSCSGTKRTLVVTQSTTKSDTGLSIKQECRGACKSAWGHGDKLRLTSYRCEETWLRKKGFAPTCPRAFAAETFFAPRCLFMFYHHRWPSKKGRPIIIPRRGTGGQGSSFRGKRRVIDRK